MSVINSDSMRAGASGAGGGGYVISNSCRFNDDDSAKTSLTLGSSPTDASKGVFGVWVKLANTGISRGIIDSTTGEAFAIMLHSSDTLYILDDGVTALRTTQVFRDPAAWAHILVSYDSDESTAADRLTLYYNGVEITSFITDGRSNITSAEAWGMTENGKTIRLGLYATEKFDGYMAQAFLVDGGSIQNGDYSVSDFIDTDSNGNVIPVNVGSNVSSWGTNGWLLDFAVAPGTGNGAGTDVSGNGNHFTDSGLAANDQMLDSPTDDADNDVGNYCTMNPLNIQGGEFQANGNLEISSSGTGGWYGTMGVASGKWYFEFKHTTTIISTVMIIGVVDDGYDFAGLRFNGYGYDDTGHGYGHDCRDGDKCYTSQSSYGSGLSQNDIVGCAFDLDNGKIWWSVNGTWIASGDPDGGTNEAFSGLSGTFIPFAENGSSGRGGTFNFGATAFAYPIGAGNNTAGFKALCTANLPAPAITDPSVAFQSLAFTGGGTAIGSGGDSFTFDGNSDLQPDLVWIKDRDSSVEHVLTDIVRGVTKELNTNDATVEEAVAEGLTAFNSDGFTCGDDASYNASGSSNIAWGWAAGAGAGASNTDGSINTITTSVNQTNGFSISTYTGTGSAATVGHGLGVPPEFVIVTSTTQAGQDWLVGHHKLNWAGDEYLFLNSTAALASAGARWNGAAPTSTVIALGTGGENNGSGKTISMLSWVGIEGFSKFGSYVGNGNSDGSFIFCGFRPAWIMIKKLTGGEHWHIFDTARGTYNLVTGFIFANDPRAEMDEASSNDIDILSNGFKCRSTNTATNYSGHEYIFAAFAESPFGGEGSAQGRAR